MRGLSRIGAMASLALMIGCTVPTPGLLVTPPAGSTPSPAPSTGIARDGSVKLRLAAIYDDGTDRLALVGSMKAYRSGVSSFTLSSPAGFICTGQTDETWSGQQTCSDGSSSSFTIPANQRGKLSGAYIVQQPGARIAVGWGRKANPTTLVALLDR